MPTKDLFPSCNETTSIDSLKKIYAAAQAEFGAFGFGQSKVGDIAYRAGVSKQLVYHYFPRKADLYKEAIDRIPCIFKSLLATNFEHADPEVVARDFITRFFQYYEENEFVGRLWLDQVLRGFSERGHNRESDILKADLLEKLSEVLARGIDEGKFSSSISAEGLLYNALVICVGYFILGPLTLPVPELSDRNRVRQIATEMVMSALRR